MKFNMDLRHVHVHSIWSVAKSITFILCNLYQIEQMVSKLRCTLQSEITFVSFKIHVYFIKNEQITKTEPNPSFFS